MRSSQRGPLSPSHLVRLRNGVSVTRPTRKRVVSALATEMTTRLRVLGIAVVPANAWNVLHVTFGTDPSWSLHKIAAHLECDQQGLCSLMAQITCAIASYDDFVSTDDFIAAVKRAREAV